MVRIFKGPFRPCRLPPLIHIFFFSRYEVYEVRDNQYGALDENGEWAGLIGMIVNGVSIHYERFMELEHSKSAQTSQLHTLFETLCGFGKKNEIFYCLLNSEDRKIKKLTLVILT